MARQASSQPTDSIATGVVSFGIQHSDSFISSVRVQHFIHLAPQTALRDSAMLQSEASLQVVSEAKDNMAGFVLANGSMSSNQSGEGDIRVRLRSATGNRARNIAPLPH
ncbi:MAG: hypothetical protein U1F81_15280 [Verrucomicrobiaceae bacterium]